MNEKIIQLELRKLFGNYDYILCNTFMYGWESDFFCISKPAGYSVEVEIKISKADFKKDFTKTDKHNLLTHHKKPAILHHARPFRPFIINGGTYDPKTYEFKRGDCSWVDFKCPANHIPNKFYYACPENLLSISEIPAYAGLIYVGESKSYEVKPAPFLHKVKKDHTASLLQKYYWKTINDRRDLYISLTQLEQKGVNNLDDYQKNIIERLKLKFHLRL